MTRSSAFRGCDSRSHALRQARLTLLALSLALLSACTLIRRPDPVTTLQLPLAGSDLAWPAVLTLGKLESTSALRGNRVLVVDGAVLMQHEGLRWVDTPAVMWSEQLRALQARADAAATPVASIDVWLTDFNMRVAAASTNTAAATAHATLHCIASARSIPVAPVSASATPASSDPQALADAFATASREVVAALLERSAERAADCAAR